MSEKAISHAYLNGLVFDLEKAFWDERGRGCRFRMMEVGREIYESDCKAHIQSAEIPAIVSAVQEVLIEKGIVGSVSYAQEDLTLRVSVQTCLHLPVEARLLEKGIEPFTCVPANLIIMGIEDKLNRQVELAEIKSENGECQLLLIIFDRPATVE